MILGWMYFLTHYLLLLVHYSFLFRTQNKLRLGHRKLGSKQIFYFSINMYSIFHLLSNETNIHNLFGIDKAFDTLGMFPCHQLLQMFGQWNLYLPHNRHNHHLWFWILHTGSCPYVLVDLCFLKYERLDAFLAHRHHLLSSEKWAVE